MIAPAPSSTTPGSTSLLQSINSPSTPASPIFLAAAAAVTTIERRSIDNVEIAYLSVIIVVGTILNSIVFVQLLRQSKTPTATTSFSTGPYHRSSFTLFKLNLSITDFAILLLHTLGKVIWLVTYEWKFGENGCKIYQFLSAFTYYSNSNVVVAIGLDRLKVVYTSHLQGAASVRRVRFLLACAWIMAAICALPQLFFWTEIELTPGWYQCTTIWQISEHYGTTTQSQQTIQFLYEIFHQSAVFWFPFFTLLGSYLLIIIKVLRYTLHPAKCGQESVSRKRHENGKRINLKLFNSREPTLLELSSSDTVGINELSLSSTVSEDLSPVKKKFSSISTTFNHLGYFLKEATANLSPRRSSSTTGTRTGEGRRSYCLSTDSPYAAQMRSIFYNSSKSNSPIWQRQLRSRVFITSLAIVVTHCAFWLPYNLLNSVRFINADLYTTMVNNGGLLLEDLIILNSLVNPILYGYESR